MEYRQNDLNDNYNLKNIDELSNEQFEQVKSDYQEFKNTLEFSKDSIHSDYISYIDAISLQYVYMYFMKYDKEYFIELIEKYTNWKPCNIRRYGIFSHIFKKAIWEFKDKPDRYTYKEPLTYILQYYQKYLPYYIDKYFMVDISIDEFKQLIDIGLSHETLNKILYIWENWDWGYVNELTNIMRTNKKLQEYHNVLDFKKLPNILSHIYSDAVYFDKTLKWFLDNDILCPLHININLLSKIIMSERINTELTKRLIEKIIDKNLFDINKLAVYDNDNKIFTYYKGYDYFLRYGKDKGSLYRNKLIKNILLLLQKRIILTDKFVDLLIKINSPILFDECLNYPEIHPGIINHIKNNS